MCGIVGFTGNSVAELLLLRSLLKLEYRVYDLAEIAVRNGSDQVEIVKVKGSLRSVKFLWKNKHIKIEGT